MMKKFFFAAFVLWSATFWISSAVLAAAQSQQVMILTTGAVWNSSTALNATQTVYSGNGSQGPNEIVVQAVTTTTITGGAIDFQATFDGTNWVTVAADQVLDPTSATLAQIAIPYTLVANTNKPFIVLTHGAQAVRLRLQTQILGTGTLTPYFAVQPSGTGSREIIVLSPSAANFNATISGTVTANQGGAPWSANITQFGGNNIATGTGAAGVGVPRITPSNEAFNCLGATTTSTPINNAGAATNLKLVSKVASQKVHICAINIGPVAAAVNVALVEGTKTTNECDTSTAGLAGGATAATGWQFAANGGLTLGNGIGQVAVSATANLDVCLLFSTGVQVSGVVTWAQF